MRAEVLSKALRTTLAYYAFPDIHRRKIRTNNPLERIMKEIRRRTHVVGAFPDGQSCLNLAAARLRHIAGTAWSTKRYMNVTALSATTLRNRSRRLIKSAKHSGLYRGMASAKVGSFVSSCHLAIGSWLLTSVDRRP